MCDFLYRPFRTRLLALALPRLFLLAAPVLRNRLKINRAPARTRARIQFFILASIVYNLYLTH